MYRVVFDTNVLLSAIIFGGKPEKAFKLARLNKIQLLISSAILAEFASRLRYKFQWNEADIVNAIKTIAYSLKLINPKIRINIIKDDPDNRILECAIDGKADFIVSGDQHLLDLEEYKKIKIINTAKFLELLQI